MIEAAKDLIRADRGRGLTLEQVGRKHYISREYVRLICSQPPDDAKRAREEAAGLTPDEVVVDSEDDTPPTPVQNVVRFRKLSDRHLEDADLQARIKAEPPNYHAIARKYGITRSAVIRIRTNAPPPRPTGFHDWNRERCAEIQRKNWAKRSREERAAIGQRIWNTRRRNASVVSRAAQPSVHNSI